MKKKEEVQSLRVTTSTSPVAAPFVQVIVVFVPVKRRLALIGPSVTSMFERRIFPDTDVAFGAVDGLRTMITKLLF